MLRNGERSVEFAVPGWLFPNCVSGYVALLLHACISQGDSSSKGPPVLPIRFTALLFRSCDADAIDELRLGVGRWYSTVVCTTGVGGFSPTFSIPGGLLKAGNCGDCGAEKTTAPVSLSWKPSTGTGNFGTSNLNSRTGNFGKFRLKAPTLALRVTEDDDMKPPATGTGGRSCTRLAQAHPPIRATLEGRRLLVMLCGLLSRRTLSATDDFSSASAMRLTLVFSI